MSLINFPILYIPNPTVGRPLFSGQIFVGEPDTDPEVVINQKQLNIVQEDGTIVAVAQPFTLSAGGVPMYNGSTVRLDVDGNYSMKILDRLGGQAYYIENVFEGEPVTVEGQINDLSQTYEMTEQEFKDTSIEFPDGKTIIITDRANSKFTKATGTGTNIYSQITTVLVSQYIELVVDLPMTPDRLSSIGGDGVNDDTLAFFFMRDTYDVYHISKPSATWLLTQNFTIHDGQTVTGDGESSLITCDDCWFGASAEETQTPISHFKIADIALKRINSQTDNDATFVLWSSVDPAGDKDLYRFLVSNVHVLSNTDNDGSVISEAFRKGSAYSLKSCYIGTIINPIMQGSGTGLEMTQQPGRSTGVNTVDFFGGEVQQCNASAYLFDVSNCFFSTTFEGAKTNGVWINGLCNGLQFSTTYLESNAAYDFRVSDTTAAGTNVGIKFNNITARSGSEAKNHSIILDAGLGISIDGYYAKGPTGYDDSVIGNNGSGSEVQGTYVNVVEAFLNTYRNLPIAPTAEAVGTPLCDNETYGFFNASRNTYEQDFTIIDSGVTDTELRNWALGNLINSRFGTPVKFKAGGSLSSSVNNKNISIHTNLGLIKNFPTTVASQDWDLEVEILIDPSLSNNAIILSKFLTDGQVQLLQRSSVSLVGVTNIIINGDSVDVAGIKCRYGNYKVER